MTTQLGTADVVVVDTDVVESLVVVTASVVVVVEGPVVVIVSQVSTTTVLTSTRPRFFMVNVVVVGAQSELVVDGTKVVVAEFVVEVVVDPQKPQFSSLSRPQESVEQQSESSIHTELDGTQEAHIPVKLEPAWVAAHTPAHPAR